MKKIKPLTQPCGSSGLRTVEPTVATLVWPFKLGSGPMEVSETGRESSR